MSLNVPAPWPWYSWAVPIALLLGVAGWAFLDGNYWLGASFTLNAMLVGGLRRNRSARYR